VTQETYKSSKKQRIFKAISWYSGVNQFFEMNSDTSISIRLLTTMAISITLYLAITSVTSDRGLLAVKSMQQDINALNGRSEKIAEGNKKLRENIWKLTNDPQEIEKIARERYGYLRAGETVYIIEE